MSDPQEMKLRPLGKVDCADFPDSDVGRLTLASAPHVYVSGKGTPTWKRPRTSACLRQNPALDYSSQSLVELSAKKLPDLLIIRAGPFQHSRVGAGAALGQRSPLGR